jgi:hypothetical protein
MTATDWHLDTIAVDRYVHGESGPIERHSIEAHCIGCRHCRQLVNDASLQPAARAERWERLADAIDRPRLLHRIVPDLARVSWASPWLTVATFTVVTVLVLAAVLATAIGSKPTFVGLLALAPVLPVGLVIAAFRPVHDPAGSLAEASPVAGGRLPFVRSLVCSSLAIAAGALACAVLPLPSPVPAAWLLPAVAFAAVVIAASTWTDPLRVGSVLAIGWWISIGAWFGDTRFVSFDSALDRLTWTDPTVHAVLLAVTAAAGIVAWMRRDARPDWRAA